MLTGRYVGTKPLKSGLPEIVGNEWFDNSQAQAHEVR